MTGPRCSDHGSMVRDLALGRLDDELALPAEEALASCPVCSRWWEETFAGEAFAEVEAAVVGAIAAFEPPRAAHRWRAGFLAAAAMLVIGLGVATVSRHTPAPVPTAADEIAATVETASGTVVASLDFESGLAEVQAQVERPSNPVPPPAPKPAVTEATLQVLTMETGDLSGWSSHS